ncbi:hypothetical protein IT570_03515 [Candidatus Sumerlaeota bacterium]|nr:hypothetical protein [Candidatus Sumerlaeota bacterium]
MASSYPESIPNYPTWVPSNAGTRVTDEVVKVPAVSPFRTHLLQKPREGDAVVVRVQSTSEERKRVPWGSSITPGTYALRDKDAAVEFHPNDYSKNMLFTYVGIGSVVRADVLNAFQDDVKAIMQWLGAGGGNFIRLGDVDPSENSLLRFDPDGGMFVLPANMYQDAEGSMVALNKVQAQRGSFVRGQRYGSGGSLSLATGWNRILTVSPSPTPVHGLFEVAYTLPSSVRGRLLFAVSASETGRAQITILTHTCSATNSVFTSMRILKPNSGETAAAVEIYLTSPTSVILEIRQIEGTVFDSANHTSAWAFVVPATAGSLTGMTGYELNVADAVFATNCNNNGFAVSSSGGVWFQGPYGVVMTSQAFTPTLAGTVTLGTSSLPFGTIYCSMASVAPGNQPVVRYDPAVNALVTDDATTYANGTFNLMDPITLETVTVQVVNGIIVHMEGAEE